MHQPGNKVFGSSTDLWVTTPMILKPTWQTELPEIIKIANVDYSPYMGVVFKKDDHLLEEQVILLILNSLRYLRSH